MSEWISVKDKLPDEKIEPVSKDFQYVLCATKAGHVLAYRYGTPLLHDEPHFWHGAAIMDDFVTHWMPFPEPPKE